MQPATNNHPHLTLSFTEIVGKYDNKAAAVDSTEPWRATVSCGTWFFSGRMPWPLVCWMACKCVYSTARCLVMGRWPVMRDARFVLSHSRLPYMEMSYIPTRTIIIQFYVCDMPVMYEEQQSDGRNTLRQNVYVCARGHQQCKETKQKSSLQLTKIIGSHLTLWAGKVCSSCWRRSVVPSPQLHSIIASLHEDMQGVVSFDGKTSEPFTIWSGVKQGCILAPTLFFSHFCWTMLSNTPRKASTYTPEVMASWLTWHDWGPRPKSAQSSSGSYFFADDAALTTHKEEELQPLVSHFSHTGKEFGLTISIRKTEVMGQDVPSPPPLYHYWQPSAWGCRPLHLPWLDHLQQPVTW